MTFRYIGSKARLINQIKTYIGRPSGSFFVDAFCGTGVVAEAAAQLGWPVRINDNLAAAVISAAARMTSVGEARFDRLGGYEAAIRALNAAPQREGFIWRAYSPASLDSTGIERRYFTEENAKAIDGARRRICEWSDAGVITPVEERLLIADLFSSLNKVANIAGTFGCFLAKWTPQSRETFTLRPRELKPQSIRLETSVGDVFDVQANRGDVVYLDPPYTKRQYASYYHILETVALADEPEVVGIAGLRPWRDRASEFCYKARALRTLCKLIDVLPSERILLSYSNQGHIGVDELETALQERGNAIMHPLGEIGRYRPNKVASEAGGSVHEFLVVVERGSKAHSCVAGGVA